MRIGIDCTVLNFSHEGIAYYIKGLLSELPLLTKTNEVILFVSEPILGAHSDNLPGEDKAWLAELEELRKKEPDKLKLATIKLPHGLFTGVRTVQVLAGEARRLGVDMLISTHSHLLPIAFMPTWWFVHDISPVIHPEYFFAPANGLTSSVKTWIQRSIFRFFFKAGLRASEKLLTSSQFVASEIQSHYRISPSKISVLGGGPGSWTELRLDPQVISKTLDRYNLRPEKYFLCINTISPRKNYPTLLRAFAQFWQQSKAKSKPKLVIVGKRGWLTEETFAVYEELKIKHSDLAKEIVFTDHLPGEGLQSLTANCLALIYPSRYEGFGMAPLEAALLDREVILSDIQVFRELYSDVAHFFPLSNGDAREVSALAKVLSEVQQGKRLLAPSAQDRLIANLSWHAAMGKLAKLVRLNSTKTTGK